MSDIPGVADVVRALAQALCAFVVIATALPILFPRAKAWWIRIFDFPRLQLAALGAAGCGVWVTVARRFDSPEVALPSLAVAAVLYQAARIWRYSPLAPREVQRSALPRSVPQIGDTKGTQMSRE